MATAFAIAAFAFSLLSMLMGLHQNNHWCKLSLRMNEQWHDRCNQINREWAERCKAIAERQNSEWGT